MRETADPTIVRAHVVDGGRVLLGLRVSNIQWSTFGGWIEAGESVEDALRRELNEEIGVVVDSFRGLPDRSATSEGQPAAIAVFVVTSWSGVPENVATHEHSDIRWFSRADLPDLPMHAQARKEALSLLEPA